MPRRLALLMAVLCALATRLPAAELTPYLVKDVNQVPHPADGRPELLRTVGSAVLFAAEDDGNGRELWRSDGTEAGTYRLADVCAGECSGGVRWLGSTPRGELFWGWNGESFGVWITDGTAAGTTRLVQGLSSSSYATTGVWVAALNRFFFVAGDGAHGNQLWTSDGTAAGTRNVAPGRLALLLGPRELSSFRGRLYFTAADAASGRALWVSDGTDAGTRLVKDPWPGPSTDPFAGPSMLRVLGNTLLFVAASPRQGSELWKSDGTSKGTVLLANLSKGAAGTTFQDARVLGSRAYFVATAGQAGQELLVTDGTAKGTKFLTSFAPADPFGQVPFLPMVSLGNTVVFVAADGPHGREPWITDGTPRGTRLLADVCPGSCSSAGSTSVITLMGSRLILRFDDGVHGSEIWVLDGPAAAPRLVSDVCPGSCASNPYGFDVVGGRMVFAASAEKNAVPGLWVTDGTDAGTVPLADSRDLSGPPAFHAALLGDVLLFPARDPGHGLELWRTRGTPASTELVRDVFAADVGGSRPNDLMVAGSRLYFFADDGTHGFELWRSDGTEVGTALVAELEPGEEPRFSPSPSSSAPLGEAVVFAIQDHLWRSDGTAAGTLELHPDVTAFRLPRDLTAMGGRVFFSVGDVYGDRALWRTDGTASGTSLVKDVDPNAGPFGYDPKNLVASGGRLFFTADTPEAGEELWQSDGSSEGTSMVFDLVEGPDSSSPRALTATSNGLLFIAGTAAGGTAIWRSDGTAAGTVEVAEVPGSFAVGPSLTGVAAGSRAFFLSRYGAWVSDGTAAGTRPLPVVPSNRHPAAFVGGWLYLAASSGADSVLWRTDGTAAGTQPVLDSQGQPVASPTELRAFAGRLVFTADHGTENALWESDGTPAGTVPLLRLDDLQGSSLGAWGLAVAGPRLFFSGYSHETSSELWALRPD